MAQSQTSSQLTFRLSDRSKQRLNEIAYEKSEPGDTVKASHVVREAVQNYIQQYDRDPDACDPATHGGLELNLEDPSENGGTA